MYFHEIAGELKILMDPFGHGGKFVRTLVGLSLRPPMNEQEEEAQYLHEYNPMEKNISLNMLDQIMEGRGKYISRARAGTICSLYDGAELAEQVDALFDGSKEHLQKFLYKKGLDVSIEELGSACILRRLTAADALTNGHSVKVNGRPKRHYSTVLLT